VWKTGEPEYHPLTKYEDNRIIGWRKNYIYKLPTGEIVAVYDDVTKKKIAQQKLNESERKYHLLFETMAQGVVFHNKKGEILSANPAAEEILGVSIEDMKMRTSANPNWEAIREDGSIYPANEHPSMLALKKGKEVKNVIMGIFNPQKEERRWLNISAVPQFNQDENQPYQVFTTFEDITERIRAERNLKESEKKYREIAELLPDIIYEADRQGNLTYVNSIGFEKFKYSAEDFKNGITLMELISEEDREKAQKNIKKLLKGREIQPTQYLMLRKDNSKFYARIHSRPISNEGKIVGIRGTVSDIHKRVIAEKKIKESEAELKHLNNLKSELLQRTSHELKTPLISIKGFTDLILKLYSDDLDEEVIQHLNEIERGCVRLEDIIKKILDTSRLDSGKMDLIKEEEDLAELIEIAIDSLKGASEAKNHEIISDIHDTMRIKIEREKILEVFENLISNAIKYTPSGGIISIRSKKTKDGYIISVHDNGIGFTKEEKSVLFTQFGKIERYGRGFDIGIDGTGLGLYVSKKIIELHGGNIWMESEGRNKGSTFYVSLPRKD
jgi:PAS domain S-box-containing protein